MSISEQTTPVYCTGQELSVGVLGECKRSAVVAQLTITMVPWGLSDGHPSKVLLSVGDLDLI